MLIIIFFWYTCLCKRDSQIHLFQSSPQNWKPNPLENPQPREVARALVEAACVVVFLKTVVANCTLYHRNFPTSETFRKKTNRINFPVTKKNTSKRPKITYPPGDFKAMSRNNVIPCFAGLLRFSSPVPTSPLPKNEYEICKFQGFPGGSAGIQPCNILLCYLCWDENVEKMMENSTTHLGTCQSLSSQLKLKVVSSS